MSSTRQASFTVPTLSLDDGADVAERLQQRLISLLDLSLTLKHIHWNVVGPNFIGVHEMLDPQYAGVQAMIDDLAERVATLGAVPSGLPGRIVDQRTWTDYDLDRADSIAHLGALDVVYQGVISDHRREIEELDELDPVSQDLLDRPERHPGEVPLDGAVAPRRLGRWHVERRRRLRARGRAGGHQQVAQRHRLALGSVGRWPPLTAAGGWPPGSRCRRC